MVIWRMAEWLQANGYKRMATSKWLQPIGYKRVATTEWLQASGYSGWLQPSGPKLEISFCSNLITFDIL